MAKLVGILLEMFFNENYHNIQNEMILLIYNLIKHNITEFIALLPIMLGELNLCSLKYIDFMMEDFIQRCTINNEVDLSIIMNKIYRDSKFFI